MGSKEGSASYLEGLEIENETLDHLGSVQKAHFDTNPFPSHPPTYPRHRGPGAVPNVDRGYHDNVESREPRDHDGVMKGIRVEAPTF